MDQIILRKPKTPLDWLRLRRLYVQAFPPEERKPFSRITGMYRQGRADVWYVEAAGHIREEEEHVQ